MTTEKTIEQKVRHFLEKIESQDKKINSFLYINKNAVNEAKEIDKKSKKAKLAGKIIAVKANICVKGMPASCASLTLKDFIAPYNATVIEKIIAEDGIIIGITNMDEFACGSSGETSAFGATQNPSAPGKIPGGSSSGSAAAVAAGFCDMALGSDTGGSIRNPASHCGVIGVKPSYGLVSRYGLIDLGMSLDQIGPLSKTVEEAALLLNIIKGQDERDTTTFHSDKIELKSQKDIKLGVLKIKNINKEIQSLIDKKTEETAKKQGWKIKEIEIKHINLAIQTYYPIVYVEFFSGTRKFDGRRFGKKIEETCGKEVLRRILGGSEIAKAEHANTYYRRALKARQIITAEFEKAFKDIDVIIMPTVPKLPHQIGEKISVEEMYACDALTIPANLAGICAISIPAGKINNIPVGLQIMCNKNEESKMLSIAKVFEQTHL